jgi:hypothetical protein
MWVMGGKSDVTRKGRVRVREWLRGPVRGLRKDQAPHRATFTSIRFQAEMSWFIHRSTQSCCTGAYTLFYTHRSHSPQLDVGQALSQSLRGAGSTEGHDA